jgi:integrase
MDRVRSELRVRHYSIRTEEAYTSWIRRYIQFHRRHPRDLDGEDLNRFLTHLAEEGRVAVSTQRQALSAILFLYRHVLKMDLDWLDDVVRARQPRRLPTVLSREEVTAVLSQLQGTVQLVVLLLYGTGMRILECLRLRVQDVDFDLGHITIRNPKGGRDRVTMLPDSTRDRLAENLITVRALHNQDLEQGFGSVYLPHTLERK